jgi:hypothetical protein
MSLATTHTAMSQPSKPRKRGRPASGDSPKLIRRNRRIVQLHGEGHSPASLRELTGLSRQTINRVLESTDSGREELEQARLTTAEARSLEKMIGRTPQFHTPEVLEWMAAQRQDRRRAGRSVEGRNN